MRRWERWLPQLIAATVTVSGLIGGNAVTRPHPPDGPSGGTVPSATASYYVVPGAATGTAAASGASGTADGSGTSGADLQAYQAGCTDGRAGLSGLRVLFFGTQELGGRLRPPGSSARSPVARVDQSWAVQSATGWVRGFVQCGRANAVLALGVNNKSDGGVPPAQAGAAWAQVVEQVAAVAPPSRVAVTGAMDGEPSWSSPTWARGWVHAYTSSTRRQLYAADSADGCPQAGPGTTCGNGWTVADVYYVATGAAPTVVALPQIYRTDGAQARQWAYVSQWAGQHAGGPLRVVGVLSQQSACRQQSGCSGTANSPADARGQLAEALGSDPQQTPLMVTDMHWLGRPPAP
jgi:hypothetical protein